MNRASAKGMSLIELMIAVLIGSILVLGLVEVFAASRTAYQMSEGMARVQENSRFAMDYLQRDLRMAGHFGCVNDQSHAQTPGELLSHFEDKDSPLQFNVSIQGYEAADTDPGKKNVALTAAGNWSPALPSYIADKLKPLGGSDIVVLRYLSAEGVPASAVTMAPNKTVIQIDPARWPTLTGNGVPNPRLFGIADCNYADIFQATTLPNGTITVENTGLNKNDFTSDRYSASPAGQAMVYRAEAVVYYVAEGSAPGTQRALFRARYLADETPVIEELVEGVDSLQLLYGLDTAAAGATPTGYIRNQVPADKVTAAEWRYVGLVRVGLLAASPNKAAAVAPDANNLPTALGVQFATPAPFDGNYRTTYESTIALRNRLYGN